MPLTIPSLQTTLKSNTLVFERRQFRLGTQFGCKAQASSLAVAGGTKLTGWWLGGLGGGAFVLEPIFVLTVSVLFNKQGF